VKRTARFLVASMPGLPVVRNCGGESRWGQLAPWLGVGGSALTLTWNRPVPKIARSNGWLTLRV